jgi:hypothetical protein
MRDLIVVVVASVVLATAWVQSHRADPTRADLAPGVGAARAYCDTGQGFQPCAFVEPNGAEI